MHDTTTPSSLWTPCPRVFDRALTGWLGFEIFDLVAMGVLLFGGFLLKPILGFPPPWIPLTLTILVAVGLWKGKRGKARGAVQHGLHELDLLPLPGVLPPTNQTYHHYNG